MIEFTVGGKRAATADGSEFEIIRENPNFSGSEGFSLGIDFPMGSDENIAIFGHINRDDVMKDSSLLPCEIRSAEVVLKGALAIVEVTEENVKGQFLEGVVYNDEELAVDSLYIDELDLGTYPEIDATKITPQSARRGTGREVCYPWQPIGYEVINCRAVSATEWHEETRKLAWQPYLRIIIERVITGAGYRPDINDLKMSDWQNALLCNTLPPTWDEPRYAKALPHWTVREFFDRLGLFFKGTFSFDETSKTVSFRFYSDTAETVTELRDVVDEYTSTVTRDEEDADYLPIKRLRYKEQDLTVWKYLDAPWIHTGNWKIAEFDNYAAYEAEQKKQNSSGHRVGESGNFVYLRDVDTYFVPRRVQIYSEGHVSASLSKKYPYATWYELQPVNVFGPAEYEEDADYDDLDVLPVMVDYALEGKMMWLPVAQTDDGDSYDTGSDAELSFGHGVTLSNGIRLGDSLVTGQSRMEHAVESHKEESTSEYFSEIYVGFPSTEVETRPYPLTDTDVFAGKIYAGTKCMRLSAGGAGGVDIDPKVKYTFRFVSDTIPSVGGIFLIHGQRYVCQRITATFSDSGMSQVLKGEFFRVIR